jgi:hypothetical protein
MKRQDVGGYRTQREKINSTAKEQRQRYCEGKQTRLSEAISYEKEANLRPSRPKAQQHFV